MKLTILQIVVVYRITVREYRRYNNTQNHWTFNLFHFNPLPIYLQVFVLLLADAQSLQIMESQLSIVIGMNQYVKWKVLETNSGTIKCGESYDHQNIWQPQCIAL